MNAAERSLLLAWYVVVVLFLVTSVSPAFGVLGAAGGVFLALPVARGRRGRGGASSELVPRRGMQLQRLVPPVGAHLAVLVALVLVAAVVPGLRDRFVALLGALVTAGAATVTAARLRRP